MCQHVSFYRHLNSADSPFSINLCIIQICQIATEAQLILAIPAFQPFTDLHPILSIPVFQSFTDLHPIPAIPAFQQQKHTLQSPIHVG